MNKEKYGKLSKEILLRVSFSRDIFWLYAWIQSKAFPAFSLHLKRTIKVAIWNYSTNRPFNLDFIKSTIDKDDEWTFLNSRKNVFHWYLEFGEGKERENSWILSNSISGLSKVAFTLMKISEFVKCVFLFLFHCT